mmetsp:Transcript_15312/g.42355  ORF Transcript_15312/g.42355 Transcript_15312/m.42355 type:complete len:86 (-) Transcript_15312:55-312(-)
MNGYVDCVKNCVDLCDATIDAQDGDGDTTLQHACMRTQMRCASFSARIIIQRRYPWSEEQWCQCHASYACRKDSHRMRFVLGQQK